MLHVVHDEMVDVALALSENVRLPYVQTVSRFGTVERGLRLSRRWCRRLVATSPDLARRAGRGARVPPRPDRRHPAGDRSRSIPSASKIRDGKVPVIGTGGPLEEASGMMIFLEAARLVLDAGYDVEFVIASHGAQQVVLRHYAQRLEIAERVTVADYPSVGAEFWPVLDIYCQPAVVASTGRTLIQALGHAIPCIATDVQGLRALIDPGENGLIVAPGDAAALQKALIEFWTIPKKGAAWALRPWIGLVSISTRTSRPTG